MFVMIFIISCGDNEISNQAPSFGFQKERIVRVNEGSTDIGTFQAADVDGDESTRYSWEFRISKLFD